jgi:hypothetical protein
VTVVNTSCIVIKTASATLAASSAVVVTLTGLTMGNATGGSSTGVVISTSADVAVSVGIASGVIGGQVAEAMFTIDIPYRVAGKKEASATFSFKTTSGGLLEMNGTITLNYPSNFFEIGSSLPTLGFTEPSGLTGTCILQTANQIVILTSTQAIPSSFLVTVTLSGLTMGAATAGNPIGIFIMTSSDPIASNGNDSGVIGGQVTNASFTMVISDRSAGKKNSTATLSFITSAGGKLHIGSTITLTFPLYFFTAVVAAGFLSPSGPTSSGIPSIPDGKSVVITIANRGIDANAAVQVTLTGLTMGSATAGISAGITIRTSADPIASVGLDSGGIELSSNSSDVSFICPAGKYCYSDSSVIVDCQPGSFSKGAASSPSCTPCPIGTYCKDAGSVAPTPCPPGKYCASPGLSAVSGICQAGSFSAGNATSAACTPCPAGKHCAAAALSNPTGDCPVASFSQGGSSNQACTPCPAGSAGNTIGLTFCKPCEPNYFSAVGSEECQILQHANVVLTMTGSIESFAEGSDHRNSFTQGIASILRIPVRQIHILSVKSGSIIVELAFMSIAASAVTPVEAVSLIEEAFLLGKLEYLGVTELSIGGRSVYTPAPPIIAIVASAGLIFVVVVLVARYIHSRIKCNIKVRPIETVAPQSQTEYSNSAAVDSLNFLKCNELPATAAFAECSKSTQQHSVSYQLAPVRVPHE